MDILQKYLGTTINGTKKMKNVLVVFLLAILVSCSQKHDAIDYTYYNTKYKIKLLVKDYGDINDIVINNTDTLTITNSPLVWNLYIYYKPGSDTIFYEPATPVLRISSRHYHFYKIKYKKGQLNLEELSTPDSTTLRQYVLISGIDKPNLSIGHMDSIECQEMKLIKITNSQGRLLDKEIFYNAKFS